MTEARRDALIRIANPDQYDRVIEMLRRSVTVTQLLPPTLAVVTLPARAGEQIPNIPGATFYFDEIPPDAVADMSADEQLFVNAWRARRNIKKRQGDQLPWDATGYSPPD